MDAYRLDFLLDGLCDYIVPIICDDKDIDKCIDRMESHGFVLYRKVKVKVEDEI